MCFFFVASKFHSEMQAMFCGRILPSLHSFSCGSDFCWNTVLFAFKFTSPLRDVSHLLDVSIIEKWYVASSQAFMTSPNHQFLVATGFPEFAVRCGQWIKIAVVRPQSRWHFDRHWLKVWGVFLLSEHQARRRTVREHSCTCYTRLTRLDRQWKKLERVFTLRISGAPPESSFPLKARRPNSGWTLLYAFYACNLSDASWRAHQVYLEIVVGVHPLIQHAKLVKWFKYFITLLSFVKATPVKIWRRKFYFATQECGGRGSSCMIILVTKPISITPVLSLARKKSEKILPVKTITQGKSKPVVENIFSYQLSYWGMSTLAVPVLLNVRPRYLWYRPLAIYSNRSLRWLRFRGCPLTANSVGDLGCVADPEQKTELKVIFG